MASKSNRNPSRAFSLLEVIITVAILSTAIVFVFRAFTTVLSSIRFSQNIILACFLAEDKLWRVENNFPDTDEAPQEEKKEVNFEFNYEKDKVSPDLVGIKKLTLTVSWEERQRENPYLLEFVTYILSDKNE